MRAAVTAPSESPPACPPASLPAEVDCLIVGGGPAGAALAGLLARRGRLALLVESGRCRTAAPVETLLPASLQALERCGLAEAVRAAAAPDRRRHGARWDGDELVFQPAGEPGLCLRRPAFDAHLRRWAAAQGAIVAAAHAGPLPARGEGEVWLRCGGAARSIATRSCVLATGRRAPGALLPTRVAAEGPATAAFAFAGGAGGPAGALAVVEATAAGWAWWIGDPGGTGLAVVAVDAEELRQRGRRALVDAVLAACRGPAAALRAARLVGGVRATARVQTTSAEVLLVGDAAATLDPLASQGTEKALVGAEAAAVAVHTALARPSLRALAIAHHAAWERELWRAHARAAGGFHARVLRFADEPFWRQRRAHAEAAAAAAVLPARLVVRPGLQAAVVLHRVGDLLEPEAGVAVPGGEPVARLGRVVVAPLLDAFARPSAIEPALAAAGRDPRLFVLGSAAVRQAVGELWRQGVLVGA